MPVMVKLSHDWADEFDVKSVYFWESESDYEDWKARIVKDIGDGETYFGFGSNQELEFQDTNDFLRGLQPLTITQEEFEVMVGVWERSGTRIYHWGFSLMEQEKGLGTGHRYFNYGNNPV